MADSITEQRAKSGAKKGRDNSSPSVFISVYLISSDLTIMSFFLFQLVCVQRRTREARSCTDQRALTSPDQAANKGAAASSDGHVDPVSMSPVITWLSSPHPRHSSVAYHSAIVCLGFRREDQHRCQESSNNKKNDRFSHNISLLFCFKSTQYSLDTMVGAIAVPRQDVLFSVNKRCVFI